MVKSKSGGTIFWGESLCIVHVGNHLSRVRQLTSSAVDGSSFILLCNDPATGLFVFMDLFIMTRYYSACDALRCTVIFGFRASSLRIGDVVEIKEEMVYGKPEVHYKYR